MHHIYVVVEVVLLWTLVYLGDFILKNYRKFSRTYKEFLEENGLSVNVAHIKWYTTRFNRCFVRWGKHHPRLVRCWFTAGVWFGVTMMVVSVLVLSWTLVQAFGKESPEQVLTPVMPGVNLPWNHIFYYLFTLTLAGAIHEIGHALAAVREQVRVNGFGMFFMVLYPGAYVDLYTEHLAVISPMRQLRIYCAGVWHNCILALVALGLLWSLPSILSFGYILNRGAVILELLKDSPIQDSFTIGDYITSVDNCVVRNVEDWRRCLKKTLGNPQNGYCTDTMTMTRKNSFKGHDAYVSNKVQDCCGNLTASRFCFSYQSTLGQKGFSCLPARGVVSERTCDSPSDCNGIGENVCLHPSLDNTSRLIKIAHNEGNDVLFVGDPHVLHYSVSLANYLPVSEILPLTLPLVLETFFMYVISLSSTLALLNATPCYWLDGHWIVYALVDFAFAKSIPDVSTRNTLCNVILTAGSFLLTSNILLALWTLGNLG